jgi:3-oxoacyl-[acyl-carrier protein] reductase
MSKLSGKTALVTGASRGIGRATALILAKEGAQVLVHYSSGAKEADAVVAEIRQAGGKAEKISADLRSPDGPHQLAQRTHEIIGGRLDILVANAGISRAASIQDTTVADFDDLFAVNVRAPFFLVQQLLPALGECGIRVNAVAPGIVPTDMSNFARTEEGRNFALSIQSLKRMAAADDIGAAVAFLASDDARWITGETLSVDGGSRL